MYVENTDGKYDEYIEAYHKLTINVAKLMARENGGNGPSDEELEAAWKNLFLVESRIAEVMEIIPFVYISPMICNPDTMKSED